MKKKSFVFFRGEGQVTLSGQVTLPTGKSEDDPGGFGKRHQMTLAFPGSIPCVNPSYSLSLTKGPHSIL